MEFLQATLQVPGWCSFRLPQGINMHFSYPVPPITTIKGLLAAALGLPHDSYHLLPELEYAVGIVRPGERIETLSKILKRDRDNRDTLVVKEKYLQPEYRIWLAGEGKELDRIYTRLLDPFFPLSLGEGDDVVEVAAVERFQASRQVAAQVVNCPVYRPELVTAGPVEVIQLPWDFIKGKRNSWQGIAYRPHWVGEKIAFKEEVEVWSTPAGGVLL
ncbi:CRISPR-associated protein Cas5 [Carboxydocella sp. JDF658]|uniref:CRISPR-associated protein Cas5 n=1 Tax=Carboxydocella sp. JDF658 TaxID=1926600 RepID=UPI0009AED6FE|nr:CRISPR-associated protein Cas5 [Carboxydocella sp. JDF658]GAW32204.1 hypothetical protein JDF658_19690 [Carboxydocella sp. JDF658]